MSDKIQNLINNWYSWFKRLFLYCEWKYIYSTWSRDNKHFTITTSNNIIWNFWFSPDRWKILDIFSKFEFLTSQIILAKLNPDINIDFWDIDLMNNWDKVLDWLSFDSKINFIKSFVDKELWKKLWKISNLRWVRNYLAHSVNIKYIEYNWWFINDNFEEFTRDLNELWGLLFEIYEWIWNQDDLYEYIIKKIENKKEECISKSVL